MRETDLYAPVKSFLIGQGYDVKSEINDCDLVALRGDEPPVIVELKLRLSLAVILQGVDRLAITDAVYVAVAAGKGARWRGQVRDAVRLCRRLGLGLITVRLAAAVPLVEIHADPGPYRPRKTPARKTVLLREFSRRVGDPNIGGQTRRPLVTAYRQDALRIARELDRASPGAPAALGRALGVSRAGSILQKDHYGWFQRVGRGAYRLNPDGARALEHYADVLDALG